MLCPAGPTQLKLSVYDHTGALVILDASSDLIGGAISYEDTPSGCGSAQLVLGMTFEQVEAAGYYTARSILELSSADDELQVDCLVGSSKLYVGSNKGYDTGLGHDIGQIAMFDGSTLTMRIPVTGVGTDGGGDYITIGAPIAGGSNPTTLPAYLAGTTIFRRRYSGIIMGRTRPNQKAPATVVRCAGLAQRINEAVCTFTLTTGTMDVGLAMFNLLNQFSSRWPELTISENNFPATGQTSFDGSYDRTQIARVISDLLSAANAGGDVWTIRIGHDRTPRLVKVYTLSGNTYTYNVTLPQGVAYFEPRNFVNTDQDASQLYNTVEVIGDTDPATQQPVTAIVQDSTSVSLYGQIDAQPVTNTACKTVAQCTLYGQALLNQQATPKANAQFVVSTRNDVSNAGPMGLSRGDVVLGLQNVTVTSFEGSAANVYGLSSSVVTTISPAGDTVQNVRFSAIEPDWNEAMKERANALASSIIKNTATQTGITSYCVSAGAFLGVPSSTSLTVTSPQFAALFAQGTAPVFVGGTTFTLVQSATNWVWILSNGSWVVNQTSAPVSNAILYGIFQTSAPLRIDTESGIGIDTESGIPLTTEAGSIIGFIPKASIGVVELSQAQLPTMGSQGAPVLTSVSSITYPVVGNATYDAQVTFTVDVVTASWLVGLALFAVPHGSAADPRDFPKGQIDVGQSSSGVYTPIWKSIGAGNAEDLYVTYLDGQGRLSPVALVGTTAANPVGTSAMGSVGTTAPVATSTLPPTFSYFANGGGTYDAEATVTLNANGTTANNALAEIECVMIPHAVGAGSTNSGWVVAGAPIAVNGSGVYTFPWGGCGVQVAYDVGVRYIGHDGGRSYVLILGTTTPTQLAQLPFQGVAIDPSTGYIVISDQAIYPTALQYQLSSAGVGSLLSASMSVKTGSTANSPTIWLMYTSTSGGYGYIAYWYEADSTVKIYKCTSGVFTLLASSTITVAHDTTNFHNLEFIATETTSGTVNLTAVLDGVLMVQATDSSSPYTSGSIAINFRDATATNYIDEKTIRIDFGGDPSSSGFKSQGSVVPSTLPQVYVSICSPTYATSPGQRIVEISSSALQVTFADLSQIPIALTDTLLDDSSGADGVWYYSVSIVLSTMTGIFYLSQTAPTVAQLMQFIADGVLPLLVGQSLTVPAGGIGSNTAAAGVSRRYI